MRSLAAEFTRGGSAGGRCRKRAAVVGGCHRKRAAVTGGRYRGRAAVRKLFLQAAAVPGRMPYGGMPRHLRLLNLVRVQHYV